MEKKQRFRGATLKRVQQFLDSHAGVVGAINQSKGRQMLDAALAESEASAIEQGTRVRSTRGERANQASLERGLRRLHLTPVSKVARAQLRDVPNFAALTPNVAQLKGEPLVRAAYAMATAAEQYQAQFVEAGRPSDFVYRIRVATDALNQSLAARAEHVRSRKGATKQVQTTLDRGRQAVALLDAALSEILFKDARLAAEWRAAKRIGISTGRRGATGSAGADGGSAEAGAPAVSLVPAVGGGTAAPSGQEVKAAA